MKRCNKLYLDAGALLDELKATAVEALQAEGEALMETMRQEAHMTTEDGAPGRSAWRAHIADNIRHTGTTIAGGQIEMTFGYTPESEAEEMRAMVVAYGSGDKAEAAGPRIHAGPWGRPVWNDDLSGRTASMVKTEYDLPEKFNQRGSQFIRNAIRRTRAKFGGHLEAAFRRLPSSVFYRKVSVRKQ